MKTNVFNEALKEARRMLPRHPQFKYYPHFSFIYQDGILISCGKNTGHEPPRHLGYHNRIMSKPKCHSEWGAYKKAAKRLIPNKSFICLNIRLNKKGETKMAAPCCCCYNVLKALGCKWFYCSSENEMWLKVV